MSRYPGAEWVPWQYNSGEGPTYYRGTNRPSAVVLHRMQGWFRTARAWAVAGHYGASWHYSIGLDGAVMQHLDHEDGGYHAGVADTQTAVRPPTWPLWKGRGLNVNNYTIGIEMEGFAGQEHPEAQLAALKALCQWLSVDLGGIPYERERYPYHGEIDVVNRVNDFNTPDIRETVYAYLFEEEQMTPEERAKLDAVYAALTGGVPGVIEQWNQNGNSVLVAYNDLVFPHLSHGAAGGLTDHRHYSNNPEASGGVIPQGATE